MKFAILLLLSTILFLRLDGVEEEIVKEFRVKNHYYIKFNNGQILHDPDCPCSYLEGQIIIDNGTKIEFASMTLTRLDY